MTATALILMVLFILLMCVGLVSSVLLLNNTRDETTGELGTAPGTDDESLMRENTYA